MSRLNNFCRVCYIWTEASFDGIVWWPTWKWAAKVDWLKLECWSELLWFEFKMEMQSNIWRAVIWQNLSEDKWAEAKGWKTLKVKQKEGGRLKSWKVEYCIYVGKSLLFKLLFVKAGLLNIAYMCNAFLFNGYLFVYVGLVNIAGAIFTSSTDICWLVNIAYLCSMELCQQLKTISRSCFSVNDRAECSELKFEKYWFAEHEERLKQNWREVQGGGRHLFHSLALQNKASVVKDVLYMCAWRFAAE